MKEMFSKIIDVVRLLPESASARRTTNPDIQRALDQHAKTADLSAANVHLTEEGLKRLTS